MKTVRKMSKRIRKKKLRMQLIKALEKMENGDGIVLVNGQVVKFSNSFVYVSPSIYIKPEIEVNALLEEAIKIRNPNEVWSK